MFPQVATSSGLGGLFELPQLVAGQPDEKDSEKLELFCRFPD
jgi:hypothetical protein